MKIKSGFVKREVMDKTVVVPAGEAGKTMKGMIKLNGTASFIWDRIEEGLNAEEIADKLAENYEVDRETALKDTNAIIENMKAAGIFEE